MRHMAHNSEGMGVPLMLLDHLHLTHHGAHSDA